MAAYGVEVLHRPGGRRCPATADAFLVTTEGGRRYGARRVLVTGGVVDELPDVPGLAERWGIDVLHCPYCHGWEVRDQPLAILATTPMAAHQALLFRQLSDDVVMVVHDGVELPDEEVEKLGAIGVRFADGTPQEVVTDGDALVGLRLADGSLLERDAIVVATKLRRASRLPRPARHRADAVRDGRRGPRLRHRGRAHRCDLGAGVFAAGNVDRHPMTLIASAGPRHRVRRLDQRRAREEETRDAVAAYESPPRRLLRAAGVGGALLRRPRLERARQRPLEAEAADLAPGRALDVGCGEGGDALWLAQHGWQVTASDFADAALARAAEHAAEAGLGDRIETRRVDVRTFEPDGETLGPRHLALRAPARRRDGRRRTPAGRGGRARRHPARGRSPPRDVHTGLRHGHHSFMHTADQLLPALDDAWKVEVCESRPRTQAHPETGEEIEIADAVLRARRVA